MSRSQLRKAVTAAVALHSACLGAAMLIAPEVTMRLTGLAYEGSLFFPRQAGVFLLLLGIVYMEAVRRPRWGWFLVFSKVVAVAFLCAEYAWEMRQDAILLAAALDGLMGATVAILILVGETPWDCASAS